MNGIRKRFHAILLWSAVVLITATGALFAEGSKEKVDYMTFSGSHSDIWKLEARKPLLIGGYGDNFSYSGEKVQPGEGSATVNLDAETNTGTMEVNFRGTINPELDKTYSGDIRIVYSTFIEGSDFWEGGVADFVYLHGDTKQEAPVMPKVKTFLATWGPADIYVNGKLIYENLIGHMMYTEGSRDRETFAVYNRDGTGFYSPMAPGDFSIANPDRKELHFVAHTSVEDTGNFPPHTVWLHLNFQEVEDAS